MLAPPRGDGGAITSARCFRRSSGCRCYRLTCNPVWSVAELSPRVPRSYSTLKRFAGICICVGHAPDESTIRLILRRAPAHVAFGQTNIARRPRLRRRSGGPWFETAAHEAAKIGEPQTSGFLTIRPGETAGACNLPDSALKCPVSEVVITPRHAPARLREQRAQQQHLMILVRFFDFEVPNRAGRLWCKGNSKSAPRPRFCYETTSLRHPALHHESAPSLNTAPTRPRIHHVPSATFLRRAGFSEKLSISSV